MSTDTMPRLEARPLPAWLRDTTADFLTECEAEARQNTKEGRRMRRLLDRIEYLETRCPTVERGHGW